MTFRSPIEQPIRRSRPSGWTTPILLAGVVTFAATLDQALGQTSPEDCNANALGAALIPTIGGVPVPPGQCVIPGQQIDYIASVFVSPNDPGKPEVVFCDVMGGQLSVTLPDYEALPLRDNQYVPTAGFPFTDPSFIPTFGNPDGADNLFTNFVPKAYIVDAAHANFQDLLNARVDYGQTAYMDLIGETQENAIVLSDPLQEGTASITRATPLCVPSIGLEKTADPAEICEGVPTQVTYTYEVTNTSSTLSGSSLLPDLTNIAVGDDMCEVVEGPFGDDGDGLLNPGETWTYSCTTTVSTTTTNTATVTAVAVAVFPVGQVIDDIQYTDDASATVTTNPNPITTATNDSPTCPGDPVQLFAEDGFVSYSWTGPDGFTSNQQNPIVDPVVFGEYCVTVADENGCQGEACTQVEPDVCEAACCFPDGSCQQLTQEQCQSKGGEYQGDDSSCDDVSCPQPDACCFNDGSCQLLFQKACEAAGGAFQGDGTSCATVDCAVLKGACCLPLSGCAVVPESVCDGVGGAYQGDLTICFPLPCDPPIGACCLPAPSCIELSQSGCNEAGGFWQGLGAECADAMCIGTGACCFADGSCEQFGQKDCQSAGGLYQGDTTNCVAIDCPVTKGACCLANGSCAVVTEVECTAAGGDYQGDNVICVPFPCGAQGDEGCIVAYWKNPNNFDSWPAVYPPDTLFGDVFDDAFPGQTLLDVLDAVGGGLTALGRQTVAALLNATSSGVNYGVSTAEVIGMFDALYPESPSEYGSLKDFFKFLNEQGCPLNGDAPDLALSVVLGGNEFDTNGAVTSDFEMPSGCDVDGMSMSNDVWRLFVADEPGVLTMSVCSSDFDTRLAVYDARDDRGVACNDDACGVQSQASFVTEAGVPYLVRVGGNDDSGTGTLDISYTPTTCPADVDGDSLVNVDDLLAVIGEWGLCPAGECPADINQDGEVGVDDVTAIVLAWGACDG